MEETAEEKIREYKKHFATVYEAFSARLAREREDEDTAQRMVQYSGSLGSFYEGKKELPLKKTRGNYENATAREIHRSLENLRFELQK